MKKDPAQTPHKEEKPKTEVPTPEKEAAVPQPKKSPKSAPKQSPKSPKSSGDPKTTVQIQDTKQGTGQTAKKRKQGRCPICWPAC